MENEKIISTVLINLYLLVGCQMNLIDDTPTQVLPTFTIVSPIETSTPTATATVTATQIPTDTPELCSVEYLGKYVDAMQEAASAFEDKIKRLLKAPDNYGLSVCTVYTGMWIDFFQTQLPLAYWPPPECFKKIREDLLEVFDHYSEVCTDQESYVEEGKP